MGISSSDTYGVESVAPPSYGWRSWSYSIFVPRPQLCEQLASALCLELVIFWNSTMWQFESTFFLDTVNLKYVKSFLSLLISPVCTLKDDSSCWVSSVNLRRQWYPTLLCRHDSKICWWVRRAKSRTWWKMSPETDCTQCTTYGCWGVCLQLSAKSIGCKRMQCHENAPADYSADEEAPNGPDSPPCASGRGPAFYHSLAPLWRDQTRQLRHPTESIQNRKLVSSSHWSAMVKSC